MKLLNQFKKLNRNELAELQKRQEQMNEHVYIVQALNTEKTLWLMKKIEEKGLDTTKRYNVDFKTGRIIPLEEVQVTPPPVEEPKK